MTTRQSRKHVSGRMHLEFKEGVMVELYNDDFIHATPENVHYFPILCTCYWLCHSSKNSIRSGQLALFQSNFYPCLLATATVRDNLG